jgi:hypothetical protein
MFAVKRQGLGSSSAYAVATLLCVASIAEAAPATNAPKPPPTSSATSKSQTPKTNAAVSKQPAATQPVASPAKAPDKKVVDHPAGTQMTWPPAPVAPQFAPDAPIDTSVSPPLLPRASRARMRACAEEWSKKKVQTKSGLPRWRNFATACLTRKAKT